ncbi:MAG TPA: SBBP repeat-containing protein, partial [Thermoanaerobaculia bacterium]|nr:SBBP repeat-containing protein [Thermoanaerobaculia bacterium]
MEVASRYRLLPAEGGSAPRVGFELAAYDRTRPLVIDPVLVYSTYLGGSGFDAGNSLAVDPAGNAYVTGETASRDFPRERHFGPQVSADVFIAKLDPSGSQLLYSTVLGGAYSDSGSSIAVDRQGEAYMTGQTFSSDFPFGTGRPAGSPPPPPVPVLQYGGGFVVKLDASGSAIVFARILHAADEPSVGTDIAVDSQGRAFVIETSGFEHRTSLLVLESNGAVASFSAGLSTGCPDPIGPDFLTVLAVDPADNLYLAGYTNQHNAFASKLTSAGALVYAT